MFCLGGMKLRFRCTANLSRGVQPDADAAAAVAAATAARFCGGAIQYCTFTEIRTDFNKLYAKIFKSSLSLQTNLNYLVFEGKRD